MTTPLALQALIDALTQLPGVGPRSASRMAFYLLHNNRRAALTLSQALEQAMQLVHHCQLCNTLSQTSVCDTCSDTTRDSTSLCIVQTPADLLAMERTGAYHGLYFILMGAIDLLADKSVQNIRFERLFLRLNIDKSNKDPAHPSNANALPPSGDAAPAHPLPQHDGWDITPHLQRVKEVIIATNFTAEGEATAHVLWQALQHFDVKITRLARGVPIGSELEHVDLGTIAHALADRR